MNTENRKQAEDRIQDNSQQTMAFYEVAGGTDELIDDALEDDKVGDGKDPAEQWIQRDRPDKPSESVIRDHIDRTDFLLVSIPDSAGFLKRLKYSESKTRWLRFRKKEKSQQLKDVVDRTRLALNTFIDNRKHDPRRELNRNLQKFSGSADLHALHAIYMFNVSSSPIRFKDVSKIATNNLDENRFKNLKRCLQEIMVAVINGSTCIYTINWFIQIYNEYLATLNRMMKFRHSELIAMEQNRFDKALEALYLGQVRVVSLMINRDELNSFKTLSRKIVNSPYAVENFSTQDIERAAVALESQPGKPIIGKMNANNIIVILMTSLLLMAKIPVFRLHKVVEGILSRVPDLSTELQIRKRVVETSLYITDFKLAMAVGDVEKQKKVMKTLYQFCRTTVQEYVSETVSSKWDADQVLRIAWIALSSQNPELFPSPEYRDVLAYAYHLLGKLIDNNAIETKGKDSESQLQKASQKQKLIDEAVLCRCKIQDIGRDLGLNFNAPQPIEE